MITTSPNGIGTITIHYDPATGKVEVPLQKIPEFSNDYVADSYTFLKSLYYITENKLYDDILLGLHVIYEVSDGENLNSLEGTELLLLAAHISYILSEEYQSTPSAIMASEAASLKLNQTIKPTRK